MSLFWKCMIVVVAASVILGFYMLPTQTLPASTRIAGTPGNPATKQLVVWSLMEKNAPAHYINSGDESSGYTTACGRWMAGVGGTTQTGSIERMEEEKRVPCGDCIRALQRFVDSASTRKREDVPTK